MAPKIAGLRVENEMIKTPTAQSNFGSGAIL
jgi:hypothetical protein